MTRALPAVAALLVLAACGTDNANGSTQVEDLADVAGRYRLVNSASPPLTLVDATTVALDIGADAITVNAGCNTLHASASLKDGKLTMTSAVMTEMGCRDDLMRQDQALATLLDKGPELTRSGPTVNLIWPTGWFGFERTGDLPAQPTNPDDPVSATPGTSATGENTRDRQ